MSAWNQSLTGNHSIKTSGNIVSGRTLLERHWHLLLLLLLIILTCTLNLIWIVADTRPPPFTDAYPQRILQFVDALSAKNGLDAWDVLPSLSLQGRSPFYSLLSVPFVLIFGRSVDSMLLVNVAFIALMLVSVYGLGRTVKDGKVGLLAAFLCATYPTLINLSHISRPNFAVPACVALSLWLLFSLTRNRSNCIAWLFGFSLGFGILMRHFFILHLLAPGLLIGFYLLLFQIKPRHPPNLRQLPGWLLDKLRDPFVLYGLLPGALISIAMTAGWYLSDAGLQFWNLLDDVQKMTSPVIRGFGTIASYSPWWYAQTASGAISNVFVAFFLFGVIMALFNPRLLRLTLVIAVTASYILMSQQMGLGWHRLGAMLPVVAVITALGIMELPGILLRRSLIAVCLVVGSFNYSIVMWGVQPWSRPIAIALGSPLESVAHSVGHSDAVTWGKTFNEDTCSWRVNAAFCPDPARKEDWRLSDIAATLLRDPKCYQSRCRVLFVSENENFNNAMLRYYVHQDFPANRHRVATYRATPLPYNRGIQRDWMLMDYVVYIPEWSAHNVGRALTQFFERPPNEFRGIFEPVESYALPSGWTARLMRRTQEVSAEQAEGIRTALALIRRKK